MNRHADSADRTHYLTLLGGQLEFLDFPAWVTTVYGTTLLRCVRINPRRTMLIACIPGEHGWVFVWPGGSAPASDHIWAAESIVRVLIR